MQTASKREDTVDPGILRMAQMAGIFVLTIGSVAGIVLIFSALARVVQRAVPPAAPRPAEGADDQRMVRLEQAVDSIAVEVERISESQRFISKLMDERRKEPSRLAP